MIQQLQGDPSITREVLEGLCELDQTSDQADGLCLQVVLGEGDVVDDGIPVF